MTRLEYYKKDVSKEFPIDGISDENLIRMLCPPPSYFKNGMRSFKKCVNNTVCRKCWNTKMKEGA
jgi:hypothetical protein